MDGKHVMPPLEFQTETMSKVTVHYRIDHAEQSGPPGKRIRPLIWKRGNAAGCGHRYELLICGTICEASDEFDRVLLGKIAS